MGHRSYGEPIIRGDISDVHIGNYCSIAQNVIMDCGWHHRPDFVTTYPLNVFFDHLAALKGHPKSKGDIIIGSDVWIGEGATIMSGVKIESGAVIGAHSVVTKDVKPYHIVAGNPAKEIRQRFNDEQIRALLDIQWWNWPESKIIEAGELLMSDNIDEFIKKYG